MRFLCLFSPSREDVPEYQDYGEECLAEAKRINAEFGTRRWQPIDVRVQEDYAFAVAAYDMYDVLLVKPTYDGMNLVAMEGPLVNSRDGVLVLSRNAGAFSRLGRQAIGVNPFDLAETAEAIREALEMPEEERARRARGMSRTVQAHTPRRGSRASSRRSTTCALPAAAADASVRTGFQSARSIVTSPAGPSTTTSAAAQRGRGLAPVHGDLDRSHAALREPVERFERSQVGDVVARVKHGLQPLVGDDPLDRPPSADDRPAPARSPSCRAGARARPRRRWAPGWPRAARERGAGSSAAR